MDSMVDSIGDDTPRGRRISQKDNTCETGSAPGHVVASESTRRPRLCERLRALSRSGLFRERSLGIS